MARTTFTGPVRSLNGFEGTFAATSVELQSNNSNKITLDAPNSLAASYNFNFPGSVGTNGQVLTSDGAGNTSWTTNGTGTVTSVGGTGTVNGLTLTGTVTASGSLTLGGQFKLADATVATLGDSTNAINTTGKYIGKMAVDYSSGIIYTAVGAAAGDDWMPSDGGTPISPTAP